MSTSTDISTLIINTATSMGVDPTLALEVAMQESGLNQSAVGSSGEIGVFQLMPATAAQLGVDPTNLQANIQGGITYLAQLLSEFGGDEQKAVAAYNCGPGCVSNAVANGGSNWLSLVPSSTQSYVAAILNNVNTQYSVSPTIFSTPALSSGVATAGTSTMSATTMLMLAAAGILLLAVLNADN